MAREIERLSDLKIRKAKEPGYYLDGAGLYLQIGPSGSKSWIYRYTLRGKTREMGLGPLLTFSLAEARERAKAQRKVLADGIDPIEARNALQAQKTLQRANTLTFAECAKQFIEDKRAGWRNGKHVDQWTNTLETYAAPVIGNMPVQEVDTGHVLRVLRGIWTTKPETASRVRSRIENVLNWAAVHEYRDKNLPNPARWRGNLDHTLPKPGKVRKVKHLAALPYSQIAEFIRELRTQPGGAGPAALEFAILTATRTGEVRGAKPEEFDLDKAMWTIPAERMKAGKEHRVFLSPRAIEILKGLPKAGDYVFPGRWPKKPMSDGAMLMTLERMGRGDVTVHGFRSTFKDWAAECTNYPNIVSEMALAHEISSDVEAAYRRGDLFEKRKRLMLDWAKYCDTPKRSGEVLPMKRRKVS